jgi:hypothetical protein
VDDKWHFKFEVTNLDSNGNWEHLVLTSDPMDEEVIRERYSNTSRTELPLPKDQFDKLYLNQLTNVLRLYFNQSNSVLEALVSETPANNGFIVANLATPADAGVGARSFVTDSSVSTFGSVVTGGGANKVPIYSDGTDWRVG